MKQQARNWTRPTLSAVALIIGLLPLPILAGSHGMNSFNGYLLDSGGGIATNDYGECWQTGYWTAEMGVAQCGAATSPKNTAKQEAAAPPIEPAPTEPEAEPKVIIRAINLGRVHFAFDRSNLNSEDKNTLDKIAIELKMDDTVDGIEITGHTDSIGTEKYNQGLSERRANSVADYLVSKGLARKLMEIKGESENQPVASNATPQGRALNRRTEIVVRRRTRIGD